ncbi:beta-galactosidase [Actinopolyspora halophila]|uniref:beta-galactosidase n=1 Tax=Actinopolyspora halophila TaxID=1850 RepID=UPI000368E430|nr:beta-galactosidase [Actinopolyspora halophila]
MSYRPFSANWFTGTRWEGRIAYGADYNPEQWSRPVWEEDVRLMNEAGVNLVSLGIFSWARVEPEPGVHDFGWLDEIMDLLHEHGIAVDLATATASPPPWLAARHPEILPVDRQGRTLWPGGRQHWRPTSPVFRDYALRLVRVLAERYRDHPALVAWHVSNELGCHNVHDHSEDAARAFRSWLCSRYGTVERLNEVWATDFWSQRYGDWEEILPPRWAAAFPNPTQQLDFQRFCSDSLKEHFRAERDVLRSVTPTVPVTTNFMVTGNAKGMNYADWAGEVDFVSNDHYLNPGPRALDELSFSAGLTGGIAGGRPWFLMEHATGAVNWRPVNKPKKPGELGRDSLVHVAHGADAVCFFQWRQSRAGAEKYHSAMLPHAGEDSDTFRAVRELGGVLAELSTVVGSSRARARVAVLFDWESWWVSEFDSHPTCLLDYRREALDWYSALIELGIVVDVVPTDVPLEWYEVVIAPVLHVVPDELSERLHRFVEAGGHLVTTYFSGTVDENDHVRLGGYPGALRELLGIRIEEFGPLFEEESVELDDGSTGTLWTDRIELTGEAVEVLASYRTGDYAGRPAITRNPRGSGSACYVSTRLGVAGLERVLGTVLDRAGVVSELPEQLRGRVQLVVRHGAQREYWFLINRTEQPVELAGLAGTEIARSARAQHSGAASVVPARGVVVLESTSE